MREMPEDWAVFFLLQEEQTALAAKRIKAGRRLRPRAPLLNLTPLHERLRFMPSRRSR